MLRNEKVEREAFYLRELLFRHACLIEERENNKSKHWKPITNNTWIHDLPITFKTLNGFLNYFPGWQWFWCRPTPAPYQYTKFYTRGEEGPSQCIRKKTSWSHQGKLYIPARSRSFSKRRKGFEKQQYLSRLYNNMILCLQASRAQILKKTTECIQTMRRKIQENQKGVEEIKKQNAILEAQSNTNKILNVIWCHVNPIFTFTLPVRMLECAKSGYVVDSTEYQQLTNGDQTLQHDSCSDGDDQDFSRRSKKMKTSYQA